MNNKIKWAAVIFIVTLLLSQQYIYAQDSNIRISPINVNTTPTFGQPKIPTGLDQVNQVPASVPIAKTPTSTEDAIKFPTSKELSLKADVSHINPDLYILGPGDGLNIIFYGRFSQKVPAVVQPDGTIFLAPANPIYVQGLTISQARRKIYRIMKKYYRNFKLDIDIVALRTFKIEILGEVNSPGTYIVTGTVGVCDAIGLAQGLRSGASLRNVELQDPSSKKKWRVDLYEWYYLGNESQNKLVSKDQIIFVPIKRDTIEIEGAFRRTGPYEIVHGETIYDIVKTMGILPEAVLGEGKVTRIPKTRDELKIIPVDVKKVLDDPKSSENITFVDGDRFYIPNISVFVKKITVIGELNGADFFGKQMNRLTGQEEIIKTGLYKLREGERVKDVVIALGGTTVNADLERARIERPIGQGKVKIIPLNLENLMYEENSSANVVLEPNDTFIIPSKPTNIYVVGEVRRPGAYKYNVGNKIKEYVAQAGGMTLRARPKATRIVQEVNGEPVVRRVDLRSILTGNEKQNFNLRPGDIIYVPYADIANWRDIVQILTDLVVLQQVFK